MDYNKVIYVDLDDTIEDLLLSWCTYLNLKYGLEVDPNDATEWDMTKLYPTLNKNQIYDALKDKELWETVLPIPGAQKYLKKLIEEGFEIYLATATHVDYFKDKYTLVIRRYFPFIDEHHIITIHNKQLLKGLVLVDDYVENLKDGDYCGILFTSYYNKEVDLSDYGRVVRADNWEECYRWIHSIYNCVNGCDIDGNS